MALSRRARVTSGHDHQKDEVQDYTGSHPGDEVSVAVESVAENTADDTAQPLRRREVPTQTVATSIVDIEDAPTLRTVPPLQPSPLRHREDPTQTVPTSIVEIEDAPTLPTVPPLQRMSSGQTPKLFRYTLAGDVEHRCHEFLRIAEVCLLAGVSKAWNVRVRRDLRELPWHVTHCAGVDPVPHVWLAALTTAKVNIRSLQVAQHVFKLLRRSTHFSTEYTLLDSMFMLRALHDSIASKYFGAVALLANPCKVLAHAAELGLLQVVIALFKHTPACPNKNTLMHHERVPLSPLVRAAKEGHVDIVAFLASLPNINLNAADNNGRTPMHYAGSEGHVNVVNALASLPNTNVNVTDNGGATPMHLAAKWGHVSVINALASLPNTNVNAADNEGLTPMHFAASKSRIDVIKSLASFPNTNVNAADNEGSTPMHYAASRGHVNVINALASLPNIKVDACDNNGRTPMDYAIMR